MQSMVNAKSQNSPFDYLRNPFFNYFYHMKNFISSLLLALACVTGLSASAPLTDDGSDAVSYCIADDVAECTLVPAPVFCLPAFAPMPCVLEVAKYPPCSLVGIESNKSKSTSIIFTASLRTNRRLQGTERIRKGNYYSIHSASCGGLARLQSPNA